MRRLNAIIVSLSMLLFLVHMVWGILGLAGFVKGGNAFFSILSYVMLTLVATHVVISVKLSIDTVIASKRSGVSYIKANRLFWIRRISGMALMVFMLMHILIFSGKNVGGVFLLNTFDMLALMTQIFMVLSLIVHLLCNITPLRIALGIEDKAGIRVDVMLVLAVLLLISAAAFVIYYIRWRMV